MYHSGIGGGGFALVRDANGSYEAIDFREAAGEAASEDMFQGNVAGSVYGGLAVGVPSEVRGLEYIHKKYGVRSARVLSHGWFNDSWFLGDLLPCGDLRHYLGRPSCKELSMSPEMASEVCGHKKNWSEVYFDLKDLHLCGG